MPNGPFFQSVPTPPQTQSSPPPNASADTTATPDAASPTEAATKLAEAIDDFLGDLEKKFKNIGDEILTKRTSVYMSVDVVL